jgi:hypothetical protein
VEAVNPFGGIDPPFGHVPFPDAAGLATTPAGDVFVASAPADPQSGGRVVRLGGKPSGPPGQPGGETPSPAAPQPRPAPAAQRLEVKLTRSSYAVRRAARLTLRLSGNLASRYRLLARASGKPRLLKRGNLIAGKRTLSVRVRLAPRRYRLVLTITGAGQTATDTASLTVLPARR